VILENVIAISGDEACNSWANLQNRLSNETHTNC